MKSKKRSTPLNSELALQITSMADIFIIILVFLLKSYSTSSVQISPSLGMQIPEATRLQSPVEAVQIEISEGLVQVEKKPVTQLQHFAFQPDDLSPGSISKAVSASLEREKRRQELIAGSNSSVQVDQKVLVIADVRTPYGTLKSVLGAAALQGFSDFKLVAIQSEGTQ
jgi:biopolymer transport protein ExbD